MENSDSNNHHENAPTDSGAAENLLQYHRQLEWRWRERTTDTAEPDRNDGLNEEYRVHIEHLRALPSRDITLATELYTLMSRSPHTSDRQLIAYMLNELGRFDVPAAIELWEKLLGDSHAPVAEDAWASLIVYLEAAGHSPFLTQAKIARLMRAFHSPIMV